jgi:hypothetical protein
MVLPVRYELNFYVLFRINLVFRCQASFSFLGWGETESTWYVVQYLAYCTSPGWYSIYECGVVSGMRIGRGNGSTRRKPAPVPLCPPQIPHDLTWDRTRAAEVESRRLIAWAMARPGCQAKVAMHLSNTPGRFFLWHWNKHEAAHIPNPGTGWSWEETASFSGAYQDGQYQSRPGRGSEDKRSYPRWETNPCRLARSRSRYWESLTHTRTIWNGNNPRRNIHKLFMAFLFRNVK